MTDKKLILVSQRVDVIESYGETRDALDQQWSSFLHEIDCLALPVANFPESVPTLLERINPDGILLTGGSSLVEYGGNSHKRDETDHLLLDYALEKKIPLFGVCRGMQSIAHYFQSPLQEITGHVATVHPVLGELSREVNSYHSLGLPSLDPTIFHVFCRSPEGYIEGFTHQSQPIMGILWHPERNQPFHPDDLERMRTFFHRKGELK